MEFENQFGASAAYDLAGAILIYRNRADDHRWEHDKKGTAIATVHDIEQTPGGPVIMDGRCVTWEAIQQLSLGLANREHRKLDILPPELLAVSMTHMIWHRPACRRRMWFTPQDRKAASAERLAKLSGETFPQPHLVFVATPGNLSVHALRTTRRPTPATPLYHAPHFNVYAGGNMCVGTARLPGSVGPELIGQFEQGFYDSNFTHAAHKSVAYGRGAGAMWAAIQRRRRFPTEYLAPAKRTFADLFKTKEKGTHD